MITGGAAATVFYNLRQRHPTLEQPIIDYDLALLFQPMLVLGISIGVSFNVIFPEWMITILLIIIFIGNGCFALQSFLHVFSFFMTLLNSLQLCQPRLSSRVLKHGKRKPELKRWSS